MLMVWEVRYGCFGEKSDLYKSKKRAESFVRRYIALHLKDFTAREDLGKDCIRSIQDKLTNEDTAETLKWWNVFQTNWNAHQHDLSLKQRRVL